MDDAAQAEQFVPAGLAALGIDADEVELAMIGALHGLLWPPLLELLSLDTKDVEPEPRPDLSRAPR